MQHWLPPCVKEKEIWAWWEGAFTDKELDWLQQKARESTIEGKAGGEVKEETRRNKIDWLRNTPDTNWVFEKLGFIAASLNSEHFNFDLDGFHEPLQLCSYHEEEQGEYKWHQDFGGPFCRKLSLVLQLSDPSEYEGGNLQIKASTNVITLKKQRGIITVFPSWTLHQVTPVVKGNRQSLVAWIAGPQFK
jgi:PKHD-type hydroxylase|tara:strand:- start:802 stop:1371 length:570 start_codon:yes stop_codon:yes gene_type:complete